MNSEIVSPLERGAERRRSVRRPLRVLAIEALGPLTILAGLAWAIAQPYRIVFFERADRGFYDYLIQPPLLVIGVGLIFAILIAPGIVDDLEDSGGSEG